MIKGTSLPRRRDAAPIELTRSKGLCRLPFLHMCHETAEPQSEAARRLSFVASVFVKAELDRLAGWRT